MVHKEVSKQRRNGISSGEQIHHESERTFEMLIVCVCTHAHVQNYASAVLDDAVYLTSVEAIQSLNKELFMLHSSMALVIA